jgi:hypothetical protein
MSDRAFFILTINIQISIINDNMKNTYNKGYGKDSELLGVFIGLDEENKVKLQELVAKNIGK